MSVPLGWRVRAALATAIVPPAISLVSFTRVAAVLGRMHAGADARDDAPDDAALAAWVDRLLRRLPGLWRHTCLRRSAVLFYLFRRAGRPTELRIGVRKDGNGELAAHAWLVRDGRPYLEADPEHPAAFSEIARFPAPVSR